MPQWDVFISHASEDKADVAQPKEWPQRALDGIWALEADGRKVLLPVWHRITYEDVAKRYPMLADRIAGSALWSRHPIYEWDPASSHGVALSGC